MNEFKLGCGRFVAAVTTLSLAAALVACGGGGGGSPPAVTPSFTISGSVSGNSANGLVLSNGADAVAVPASAPSFTFSSPVTQGATYTVVIKTQPTGLTCSVTNGSGTMGGSAVVNVQVACVVSSPSAQAFGLGGAISGLSTSGLTLAEGAQTLAVAANESSFAMPLPLPPGTAYLVKVQTQPSGLTCTVANASGTMGVAPVANIVVTCLSNTPSAVGGTISGYTDTGLALRNGGDVLFIAKGVTAFTFPTPLIQGSAYSVTIQSQPATQTCSVANGNGKIGASAVTNVQVTCGANVYTIGGSINGYTGSGLVITNGNDVLPIATAGSFQMPTPVPALGVYDVTVQTQPDNQTCAVVNGSGAVSSAPVSNIQVNCVAALVQFAYVANSASSNVSGFAVNANTGTLTPLAGSPFATGTSPQGMMVDPNKRYLYVTNVNSNNISVFSINPTSGALSPIVGSPFATGTNPYSFTRDSSGKFLLVTNAGSNNVSVYAVNSTTGALSQVPGSPFPTGASPRAVLVNTSDKYAYVANYADNTISGFSMNNATGFLTPIPGSPFTFASVSGPSELVEFLAQNNGSTGPFFEFLWVVSSPTSGQFLIDADTGALGPGNPYPPICSGFQLFGKTQAGVKTRDSTNQFEFTVNSATNDISVNARTLGGGGICSKGYWGTPVVGSPFTVGISPVAVVVVAP